MGLLYGENCMILTSAVFDWSTRVTDRQTDRQTDGIAIAYARLAYMLSRAKKNPCSRVHQNTPFYVKNPNISWGGTWPPPATTPLGGASTFACCAHSRIPSLESGYGPARGAFSLLAPALCPSVRPFVCHTLALSENDASYDHEIFTSG